MWVSLRRLKGLKTGLEPVFRRLRRRVEKAETGSTEVTGSEIKTNLCKPVQAKNPQLNLATISNYLLFKFEHLIILTHFLVMP